MPRYHMTENGPVQFTAEEEAAKDIEEAAWAAGAKDRHNAVMKQSREEAYKIEADGLFFKAQRGEINMQEWQNKVAEIKARFPYQE